MLRRCAVFLLAAVLVALAVPAAAPAANLAATFTKRLGVNDNGDITIIGNTLMTCPASGSCASALDAALTQPASGFANNDFNMGYVDVDSDASTFNSSTASLALPDEATVLFAGLYWGAKTDKSGLGSAPVNIAQKNVVKFRTPSGAGYANVTAQGNAATTSTAYQHFADVTTQVRAAGPGLYGVANVQAGTGSDRYAGWSLVVAYRDPDEITRNLSVFDGLGNVNTGDNLEITVNGFTTTTSGTVRTSLGVVAYEGDMGIGGDSFKLQGTTLSDAVNPATDFFNSSVSVRGARVTAGRSPAVRNHLGFDIDMLNADGILANGAMSAKLNVMSTGEAIYPAVLTFASQLLAAKIRPVTTATDLNGGLVEPGDVIEYVVHAKNIGNDTATGVALTSSLPAGVELVDGSLELVQDEVTGVQTTTAGDDRATYDPATRRITWRIGAGATSAAGGSVPEAGEVVLRYRVRLGTPANGTTLTAEQIASLRSQTTSDQFDVTGRGGALTVSAADLRMAIARTGALVRGRTASYALTVDNPGAITAGGTVRVTDTLPAGLALDGAASGTGWSCSAVGQAVTCERADGLAAGATWPAITVPVRVGQDAPASIDHAATVRASGDGTPGNDTATDSASVTSRSGVSVTLARSAASVAPGDTVTLTATVANAGPSDAVGATVALPVPAGMELVSTTGPLGTVPAGGSATVSWTLRARRAAAGSTQSATATVIAPGDTTSGDDSASVSVAVARQSLVSVAAVVDPDPPVVGSPLRLRMTVRNDGPTTATGVVLTHVLPAQLQGAAATIDPAQGSCAIAAGTLRCTISSLADGDAVRIDLDGTIASAAGGAALDLRAALDPVADDPDATDDAARIQTTVRAAADLGVAVAAAPATLRAGEHGTFVLRVGDAGPGDAADVLLRATLPAGVSLVDHAGAACSAEGPHLACSLGALAAGTTRDVRLGLALDPGMDAGPVAFTAGVTANEPDPTPASTPVGVSVTRSSALAVAWSPAAAPVAGARTTLTAALANQGPSEARDAVLTVRLPDGLRSPSVTVRGGDACTIADGVATCPVGRVAAGARMLVDVAGTPSASDAGRALVLKATAAAPGAQGDAAPLALTSVAVHDISVGAIAPAGRIPAGTRADLTLTARNDGPSDSDAVTVVQTLPVGATAVELDPRCAQQGRVVTCSLGAIAAGVEGRVRLVVRSTRAMSGAALASAVAASTAAGTDPQLGNNTLGAVADLGCESRRRVTMRLRLPARSHLRSVSVAVRGKQVPVRVGKRLTATVDLRGRPAGRFVVRIRARTRSGRTLEGTRAYQTCTPKRASGRVPRI